MKKLLIISALVVGSLFAINTVNAETKELTPNRNIEEKLQVIEEMVEAKELTQEEADTIIEKLENCDGTQRKLGQEYNLQFGRRLNQKGNGNGNHGNCENCQVSN